MKILSVFFTLLVSSAAFSQNLLTNGGFEEGTLGWSMGGAVISSEQTRSGSFSAKSVNQTLEQLIQTQPGVSYKLVGWVKLHLESGTDWGGFSVSAISYNWNDLGTSGYLTRQERGSDWFKVAVSFVATTPATRIRIGYFGGPGRVITAFVDDFMVREAASNLPPDITAVISPDTVGSLPASISYSVLGDDPDGAIVRIDWDFGDGIHSQLASGVRTVAVPGNYTARLRVSDDDGAVVTRLIQWSASDPAYPSISIDQPAQPFTVSDPTYRLSGTVTGQGLSVTVWTDREYLSPALLPDFSIDVPLKPGRNRLTVQARDSSGRIITAIREVDYWSQGGLEIRNIPSPLTVEQFQVLELPFQVSGVRATHFQFPYTEEKAPGLEHIDGITVDALFTPDNWRTVYRRPAFWYQPYQRQQRSGEEWLYPSGEPGWLVRFAPPLPGKWRYRIEAADRGGSAVSSESSFTVTPASPGNHGPVTVSRTDPRYFEHLDGTPFLGPGHGIGTQAELFSFSMSSQLDAIGQGNQNFFRWWVAGNIWASAWLPWASRTLPYEGTVPATGLSLEAAYGDGFAALKLDDANPLMFQGFMSGHAPLIPGRQYEVRVRWMARDVTGPKNPAYPYGVCLKFTGWPEPGETLDLPVLAGHINGSVPWSVASARFTSSDYLLPNLAVILENTTGGAAYIDEISLYEVLPGGGFGPQLLRSPRMNSHLTFDPRRGFGMDAIFREASERKVFFKLVISEKQEWLLNHIAPDGLPEPLGGQFNKAGGAGEVLHRWHWRHLFARFGAFSSLHSWELVNEEAPGPGEHFRLTARLAEMAAQDGNPHPASTSTWATLAEDAWKHPDSAPIGYTDFHAYVRSTGWLGPRDELANDSARFFHEYDLAGKAAQFGKPVVWGEMGIDGFGGSDGEDPGLALDTQGVWLHKIIWARTGPGGVYPLYWYTDNIFNNSLHRLFGNWNRFMEGIPISNGRYRDISAVTNHPNLRVLGQKDTQAGRAHLWIDNSTHTWRGVVDNRPPSPVSGQIFINIGASGTRYLAEWYDTGSGSLISTQQVTSSQAGIIALEVSGLEKDVAVRILPHPEETPLPPTVHDSGEYTTDGNSLSVGIAFPSSAQAMEYSVGSSAGKDDISPWEQAAPAVLLEITGLSLDTRISAFVNVRYRAGNGLWSGIGSSDGIRFARPVASIAEAKLTPDDEAVALPVLPISATFPDAYYLISPDRSAGLRVTGQRGGATGAAVTGVMQTLEDEKCLTKAYAVPADTPPPGPVQVIARSLFGDNWYFNPINLAGQVGVAGGTGLSTTGLYVRLAGVAAGAVPGGFWLEDGSQAGVLVIAPPEKVPSAGQWVAATGIASIYRDAGVLLPRLLAVDVESL